MDAAGKLLHTNRDTVEGRTKKPCRNLKLRPLSRLLPSPAAVEIVLDPHLSKPFIQGLGISVVDHRHGRGRGHLLSTPIHSLGMSSHRLESNSFVASKRISNRPLLP